jgi:hypothetical protein
VPYMQEVMGLDLGQDAACHDLCFPSFSSAPQGKYRGNTSMYVTVSCENVDLFNLVHGEGGIF